MFNNRLENILGTHTLSWAPVEGGENRRSPPPPPPPWKIKHFFFAMWVGGILVTFFHVTAFLLRFSTYGEPMSPCEVLSAPLFSMRGIFCYVFSTYSYLAGSPFYYVRAFNSAPFFSMFEGGLFLLSWGEAFMGGAHAHYIYYNTVRHVKMYQCTNR